MGSITITFFMMVIFEVIIHANCTECDSTHPFAYDDGRYCCSTLTSSHNMDEINYRSGHVCPDPVMCPKSWWCQFWGSSCPCTSYKETGTCPGTHIFPYNYGKHCCKYNLAGNGNELKYDTTNCKDEESQRCINGKLNDDDESICPRRQVCPERYPYAYQNGEKCCKYSNGVYSIGSLICDNKIREEDDDASISVECAAGYLCQSRYYYCSYPYPYVFGNGKMCCNKNRDCDDGPITLTSTCCQGDTQECEYGSCTAREECPAKHPYAYSDGEFCCDTLQFNAAMNINLSNVHGQRSACKGDHTHCDQKLCVTRMDSSDVLEPKPQGQDR
jgi:hypothetical protein